LFYGERYKPFGGEVEFEFCFCVVREASNGLVHIANGQFMWESELGERWAFAKTNYPDIPKI